MPSLKKKLFFNSGSRKHQAQYMCIKDANDWGHFFYPWGLCSHKLWLKPLENLAWAQHYISWIAKPHMHLWHDNSWTFRNNTERRVIALHPTNFLKPSLMTSFESSVLATLAWDSNSWTVSEYNLSFPTPQPGRLVAETWRSQCARKHYPRQWKLM